MNHVPPGSSASSPRLFHAAIHAEQVYLYSCLETLRRLPGNPFDVEVQHFGGAMAITMRRAAEAAQFNRILHLTREDARRLPAIAAFFNDALLWHAEVFSAELAPDLTARLHDHQLRAANHHLDLLVTPLPLAIPEGPASVVVHRVATKTLPLFMDIYKRGFTGIFGGGTYTASVIAEAMSLLHNHPEWHLYIAHVDGVPAAVALLHVVGTTASLAGATTLPSLRRRGAQTALIYRRLRDASNLGCEVAVAQASHGSRSSMNLQRLGLRVAHTMDVWRSTAPWPRRLLHRAHAHLRHWLPVPRPTNLLSAR